MNLIYRCEHGCNRLLRLYGIRSGPYLEFREAVGFRVLIDAYVLNMRAWLNYAFKDHIHIRTRIAVAPRRFQRGHALIRSKVHMDAIQKQNPYSTSYRIRQLTYLQLYRFDYIFFQFRVDRR